LNKKAGRSIKKGLSKKSGNKTRIDYVGDLPKEFSWKD
jgi:hypothetical protein